MDILSPQSTGGDQSRHVDIPDSPFEQEELLQERDSSKEDPADADAPEKKLTLFAFRLAVLERIATGLGALGFIWATVVLLGGLVALLYRTDFWFVTIILVIEGARLFSRSNELELQHQSTGTITHVFVRVIKGTKEPISESQSGEPTKEKTNEAGPSNGLTSTSAPEPKRKNNGKGSARRWAPSEVPLLPHIGRFFPFSNISQLFYWLQLLSAIACIAISVVRLIEISHEAAGMDKYSLNMTSALTIFYVLALVEGFFCLLEKLYWEWMIVFRRVLEMVTRECGLESSHGINCVKRFFYDAYSECVNNSIFDGLKMDLISFASELLASHSSEERLHGAQILHNFSNSKVFADETLQKIGTSEIIERLVEMLSWKNPEDTEIRQAAAEIVTILAGKKHYSLRIVGIPGAMESISSLLHTQRGSDSASDEIDEKKISDQGNDDYFIFNKFGLTILEELAHDHHNCEKIGNTRGLLSKIIDFTHWGEGLLKCNDEDDILKPPLKLLQLSLKLLKLLAGIYGNVGNNLRQEIVENVFIVSNIREILKYGEKYPKLLGIEILTSLAFDVKATERIGNTGGIITELFRIFFQEQNSKDQHNVRVAAGEAIAMLALDSDKNCSRILKQDKVLPKLVQALEDPDLRINSARILRNLCTYAGQDNFKKLQEVSAAATIVLKEIIMSEENKLQEVMLGLATHVFKFMTPEQAIEIGIDEANLAMKLLDILKCYRYPSAKVPRIRRFAIELAILMMKKNKATVQIFKTHGMVKELKILGETTSDIESFNVFSGTVGLSQHRTTIQTLVESAIELMEDSEISNYIVES